MSYLVIENKANVMPSVEAIRMLGVSFSRGTDSKIGQFGSGFPASLALLARHKLLDSLKLCLGKEVYTFSTVGHSMKDANGNWTTKEEIRMRKQGGGSWDLNISTEFGELDWFDVTMAIREFVSNGLDGADSFDGTYGSFRAEVLPGDDSKVCRAKDGFIRVYIKTNDEIEEYARDINKAFLCMTDGYDQDRKIYVNRSGESARVYRKGVLVGTFGYDTSLFHYNIKDLNLKESRIVDSSEARDKCARAIGLGSVDVIVRFLEGMKDENQNRYWEQEFSPYYMNPEHMYDLTVAQREQAKRNWKEAIDQVLNGTVVVESETIAAMVSAKDLKVYQPKSSAYAGMLKTLGARSSDSVLSKREIEGESVADAKDQLESRLMDAFNEAVRNGLNRGHVGDVYVKAVGKMKF